MADTDNVADDTATENSSSQSESNSVMIKVGALLAVVLAIQVTVVMVFLKPPQAVITGDDAQIQEAAEATNNVTEVEIDSFSCANNEAIQASVVHVNFSLSVVVNDSNKDNFVEAFTHHSNKRIIESVEKVARSAKLEDLSDPELATIKLKIKEAINRVMRKSYVERAIIYKFTMIEQ